MDDSEFVRSVEAPSDLDEEGDRFFYREGIAVDVFAEGMIVNVLHYEVMEAVLRVVSESVEDGNILVIEGRQCLRFAFETPEEFGFF
jgi:hypothetical protein